MADGYSDEQYVSATIELGTIAEVIARIEHTPFPSVLEEEMLIGLREALIKHGDPTHPVRLAFPKLTLLKDKGGNVSR